MNHHTTQTHVPTRHRLGLSFPAIIGLAALALPRVVLHDLRILDEGHPLTWLLALAPVAIWIAVAVVKRVPQPFPTVLVIGVVFGAMLVVTHQLLWDVNFGGNPPSIGTGSAATTIPRLAAIPSGLFTGTMIGAIGGLIAAGIRAIDTRRNRDAFGSGDHDTNPAVPGADTDAARPTGAGRSVGVGALGMVAGVLAMILIQDGLAVLGAGGGLSIELAVVLGSMIPIAGVLGAVAALLIDKKIREHR